MENHRRYINGLNSHRLYDKYRNKSTNYINYNEYLTPRNDRNNTFKWKVKIMIEKINAVLKAAKANREKLIFSHKIQNYQKKDSDFNSREEMIINHCINTMLTIMSNNFEDVSNSSNKSKSFHNNINKCNTTNNIYEYSYKNLNKKSIYNLKSNINNNRPRNNYIRMDFNTIGNNNTIEKINNNNLYNNYGLRSYLSIEKKELKIQSIERFSINKKILEKNKNNLNENLNKNLIEQNKKLEQKLKQMEEENKMLKINNRKYDELEKNYKELENKTKNIIEILMLLEKIENKTNNLIMCNKLLFDFFKNSPLNEANISSKNSNCVDYKRIIKIVYLRYLLFKKVIKQKNILNIYFKRLKDIIKSLKLIEEKKKLILKRNKKLKDLVDKKIKEKKSQIQKYFNKFNNKRLEEKLIKLNNNKEPKTEDIKSVIIISKKTKKLRKLFIKRILRINFNRFLYNVNLINN